MNDDDIDAARDIDFAPAVSATGGDDTAAAAAPRRRTGRRRNGLRRKLAGSVVLLGALGAMGTAYATFATSSGAETSTTNAELIAKGEQIYQNSCITCHGTNLQGVVANGPSLVGTGGAATYFQVITGRMPVAAQGAQIERKTPKFDEEQTEALAAYVQSIGGGESIPDGKLRGTDSQIAEGGALFRLNCASCHGATGAGAPLSAGKYAPSLSVATDKEIYTAMLSGPQNMPVFSDNSITPQEKQSIIAYVQMLRDTQDPGGSGIARIGPVSEAVVIWVAGVGALMVAILWIGARSR